MRRKAKCLFMIWILALWASAPGYTADYEFCVFSDVRDAHLKVKADDASQPNVVNEVERFFCNRVFGLVCAAIAFNTDACGRLTAENLDVTTFGSVWTYHENSDGTPAERKPIKARLSARAFPDASKYDTPLANAFAAANAHLQRAGCPAAITLAAPVTVFPAAYARVALASETALQRAAKFPGTLKIVQDIQYCGDNRRTVTVDQYGTERTEECTLPHYYTSFITFRRTDFEDIILLRSLAYLANINDSATPEARYTISDPDILVPKSDILDGQRGAFKITKLQCVRLIKFLMADGANVGGP